MGAYLVNHDMALRVIVIGYSRKHNGPQAGKDKQKLPPSSVGARSPLASKHPQNKREAVCSRKAENIQQHVPLIFDQKITIAEQRIQDAGDSRQNQKRIAQRIRRKLQRIFLFPVPAPQDSRYITRYDKQYNAR